MEPSDDQEPAPTGKSNAPGKSNARKPKGGAAADRGRPPIGASADRMSNEGDAPPGDPPTVPFLQFDFSDSSRQATHVDVEFYYVVHSKPGKHWKGQRLSVSISKELHNGSVRIESPFDLEGKPRDKSLLDQDGKPRDKSLLDQDGKQLANVTEILFAPRRFGSPLAGPARIHALAGCRMVAAMGQLEGGRVLSTRVMGVAHRVRPPRPAAGRCEPELFCKHEVGFQDFEYHDYSYPKIVKKVRIHLHHKTPEIPNPFQDTKTLSNGSATWTLELLDVYQVSFETLDLQGKPIAGIVPAICSLESTTGLYFTRVTGETNGTNAGRANYFSKVDEMEE